MFFYYLTLFLIPFQTHWMLSYSFHGFTPVKVAGGLAFLWALLSLSNSQTRVYFQSRSKKYCGLLAAFIFLSVATHGFNVSTDGWYRFITLVMLYFTTVTLVNTRERLFASCVVLLIAMDVASAYMVRQYLQYNPIYAGFRPGGVFIDANYYAASALVVLPIAYFLRRQSTSKLFSLFCLGTVGAILTGLVISQSRGGLIGLAAVVLMLLYESRARFRTIASLCVVAILIVMFSPINPLRRFDPEVGGVKSSTDMHILVLYSGLNMVRDNPLFGVGLGNFRSYSMAYSDDLPRLHMAHNSYLELAADNGIPVTIFFLLMCLAVIRDITNARYLHEQDPVTNSVLTGMRVGIIGFLTAATFFSAEYEKMFWVLCFLAMATTKLEPQIEQMEDLDDLESAWEESEDGHPLPEPGSIAPSP
jgi:O-antigen ligase